MNKRKSTDEAVRETSKKAKINDENELISRLQNFVNEHVRKKLFCIKISFNYMPSVETDTTKCMA